MRRLSICTFSSLINAPKNPRPPLELTQHSKTPASGVCPRCRSCWTPARVRPNPADSRAHGRPSRPANRTASIAHCARSADGSRRMPAKTCRPQSHSPRGWETSNLWWPSRFASRPASRSAPRSTSSRTSPGRCSARSRTSTHRSAPPVRRVRFSDTRTHRWCWA